MSSRRSASRGVQNFPTVGLIDGMFRANLEETGMGYGLEVDLVRRAHAKDLLTTPYVFDPAQAKAMVEAGADIVVAHMGLTVGGAIGAATCAQARRLRRADQRHRGGGARGARRRHRPLSRRSDRDAGGRKLHPGALPGLPRLLRREQHGAAAGRDRAREPDPQLQGDQAPCAMIGRGRCRRAEHFPAKWTPVRHRKCDQCNESGQSGRKA